MVDQKEKCQHFYVQYAERERERERDIERVREREQALVLSVEYCLVLEWA